MPASVGTLAILEDGVLGGGGNAALIRLHEIVEQAIQTVRFLIV
jgi:hypothetical protein